MFQIASLEVAWTDYIRVKSSCLFCKPLSNTTLMYPARLQAVRLINELETVAYEGGSAEV